jgi:hypothetical protein
VDHDGGLEDQILLKMIFHRPKDIEDVRRMIAANRDALDVRCLETWIEMTLESGPARELRDMLELDRPRSPVRPGLTALRMGPDSPGGRTLKSRVWWLAQGRKGCAPRLKGGPAGQGRH